ncbi:dipicolinate synthase subunit B [Thermosyntropha lipolytica DSM 11003]|uniref:Dipicolinate synthase subunit B n=1 Tax=Thermosyntropha lipolytica DSM 11003 TaxID=1123382 RepID=A0A1M5PWQ8_9FIRM|nr:dipicolinate synthase subunit B [Thermosyntropha lipolytica]SHH06126.1 dipicolinate synthase subunit B [Thermosyntropha lipolytica DSM 11003]
MQEAKKARLKGVKIGVVLTGSHCTVAEVIPEIKALKEEGAEIYPIFSYTVDETDNRFYKVEDLKKQIKEITEHNIINTIVGAEPIGPHKLLDILLVAPATGNTIAKLANGIVDTPALMAIKAQLRNQRPVVIAISTNDALGINARNIGMLLNMKNIYFVPFRQDNPVEKANSLVAQMDKIVDTIILALQGKQIQPVLLGPANC